MGEGESCRARLVKHAPWPGVTHAAQPCTALRLTRLAGLSVQSQEQAATLRARLQGCDERQRIDPPMVGALPASHDWLCHGCARGGARGRH